MLFLEEKSQTIATRAAFTNRRSLPSKNKEPDAASRTGHGYPRVSTNNYDTWLYVVHMWLHLRGWTKPVKATTEDTAYLASPRKIRCSHRYTRWFKYDRDRLCVNKSQFVPVMFEPPCIFNLKTGTGTPFFQHTYTPTSYYFYTQIPTTFLTFQHCLTSHSAPRTQPTFPLTLLSHLKHITTCQLM